MHENGGEHEWLSHDHICVGIDDHFGCLHTLRVGHANGHAANSAGRPNFNIYALSAHRNINKDTHRSADRHAFACTWFILTSRDFKRIPCAGIELALAGQLHSIF